MGLESSNNDSSSAQSGAGATVHWHCQYAVKFTGPPSPPGPPGPAGPRVGTMNLSLRVPGRLGGSAAPPATDWRRPASSIVTRRRASRRDGHGASHGELRLKDRTWKLEHWKLPSPGSETPPASRLSDGQCPGHWHCLAVTLRCHAGPGPPGLESRRLRRSLAVQLSGPGGLRLTRTLPVPESELAVRLRQSGPTPGGLGVRL